MIWLIILIILLLGVIGALVYALRISSGKIEFYEDFILRRQTAYRTLLANIREIDSKEMFEKDEDVGVIFSEIKREIEEFENLMEDEE